MRASHAAVLRQGSRRVHSEWQGGWVEQDSAADRNLLPTLTDSGAADHADRRDDSEGHRTARGRSGDRGAAPLHDDAGSGETAFSGGYLVDAGLLPRRAGDADRISVAD